MTISAGVNAVVSVLWTSARREQTTLLVSTVMRGRVEVSMGDGGRVGIRRERCGGGESPLW